MTAARSRLRAVVAALRKAHGAVSPGPTSPWAQVLWESCCYLADDERRAAAFALLERKTRLAPARIVDAPTEVLLAVAAHGVSAPRHADRMRECARIALGEHGGDLDGSLAAMTPAARRKALRAFAGIGAPGAEKILLVAGLEATCALDSNGLRVVGRLGYVAPDASYARQWGAARRAIAGEAPSDGGGLVELYALLRRHGQAICTRTRPRCDGCPLAGGAIACPSAVR